MMGLNRKKQQCNDQLGGEKHTIAKEDEEKEKK